MGIVKRIQGRLNLLGLPRRVQVHCERELHGLQRIGWTVCPTLLSAESIAYSFGVGRNISFDLSLIERFGMVVHAFDPTPFAAGWVRVATGLPAQFRFHEWGLADYDGCARFKPSLKFTANYTLLDRPATEHLAVEAAVYRLSTIMDRLGHDHIDLLKMDIEGAEYGVIQDIVASQARVTQILVEWHHRWRNVGKRRTREAIALLNRGGYRIFNISEAGNEMSFIRDGDPVRHERCERHVELQRSD